MMTNSEAIKQLKHQVYKNTDNCEMKISKNRCKAIINALEEDAKFKAEVEEMVKTLVGIDKGSIYRVFCENICKLRDNNCPVAVKNEACPISIEDCISGWLRARCLNDPKI